MIFLLLLASIGLAVPTVLSQELSCGKIITLKGQVHVERDPLGQVLLFNDREIIKISSGDTLFNRFSQMAWGPIHQVDASNPMKIVVFYKEAARIIFLDNTLSPNGDPIDLIALNYDQTELTCASIDNCIWLYDRLNFRLIRLNTQLQPLVTIPNLNQILNGKTDFCRLDERNNRLYLSSADGQVFVFDLYGSLLTTITCPVPCRCRPSDKGLRVTLNGNLVEMDLRTRQPIILHSTLKNADLLEWISEDRAIIKVSDNNYRVCKVP